MSISRLLMLGLLYLPIGFVLGYAYTNYTQASKSHEAEVVDTTSLSPWEARYHQLETKFKELSKSVDNIYSGDKSGEPNATSKIDAKKLLNSVEVLFNNQYAELETDVKQNILELCQSVVEKKKQ